MDIKALSSEFLTLRAERDEQRRIIDYDLRNEKQALEKLPEGGFKKLRLFELNEKITQAEKSFQNLQTMLNDLIAQLKPALHQGNFNYIDKLEIHVHDRTYSSVWLDDDGNIQGLKNYTKL